MSKKRKMKRYKSVKTMFREMEKENKKHPVRAWLRPKFWQMVRFPEDVKRAIRTFIQRGKRGYASSDVWGLGYYLSDVISKSVGYLKDHNYGMPNGLTEGQWVDILNEIRDTFDTAKGITDGKLYLIENKKDRKRLEKCLEDNNKEYKTYDRCLSDKEIETYKNGWKLFQKYFLDLWD